MAPSVGLTVEFVVRPDCDEAVLPLIEFRGDPRDEDYPPMLRLLAATLPGLRTSAQPRFTDDDIGDCCFDGGEFEVSDDWGGLFVQAKADHARVIEVVATALERTGAFSRIGAVR